jgi:transposase
VDSNCVRGWIDKFGTDQEAAPAGEGTLQAELRRLRKENARLLMERDILKEAAAFFAREQP